jgi:superfamily I DNA/RNA helicase
VHEHSGQFQPWAIHQVFVDEVQDFLEAELIVSISCSDDARALFLTGDTAQSIARGVGFRFSEVRRVFHFLPNVKPPEIQALPYNYRSHTGILRLASGILEVLQTLYPGSFDKLDHDRGFFRGPLPAALLACEVADLAIMLRSTRRSSEATSIEFGARQVILVANERTKENMPEALRDAVILTIVEAKGLEFDDVLLYNVSFVLNAECHSFHERWDVDSLRFAYLR